jgi:hypothetical protein
MIDCSYFTDHLPAQLRGMKGASTVRIHLHDGLTVLVRQLENAESGFVLIQAYPLDGSDAQLDRESSDLAIEEGSSLAIPYESISHVEVTHKTSQGLGFEEAGPLQEARA